MVDFFEGLRRATKAVDCALLSATGAVLGAAGSLPGGDPTFVNNAVKALRRLRGCDPANDPEPDPPPFFGGQCPGQRYLFKFRGRQTNPVADTGVVETIMRGPLFIDRSLNPGDFCAPPLTYKRWTLRGQNNAAAGLYAGCTATLEVISVEALDGGDGEGCGDLPPTFPPPGDTTIDIDVTYNIEEGPDIDVTVPVIFSPFFIDFNGNFNFPTRFNFGDIDFTGNVSFTPEFNFSINPPVLPRGTNNPVDELPGPEDEIPVEPSTFEERVVGVVVQSALVGEQQLTTIATDNIPQILAPRCGSVKFGYAIAGRSFWSPDIDIKDLNCFIPCPFSQGADTVAASPAPGVVLNYVPIFGAPLATVADLGSTPEP